MGIERFHNWGGGGFRFGVRVLETVGGLCHSESDTGWKETRELCGK